jgi:hypothetical protein
MNIANDGAQRRTRQSTDAGDLAQLLDAQTRTAGEQSLASGSKGSTVRVRRSPGGSQAETGHRKFSSSKWPPQSYGMDAPTLNGIDVPKWKC